MDDRTVRALNRINRSFYHETSAEFDASRGHAWPGWSRVADHIDTTPEVPIRVLDVGCGNARFAAFLADRLAEDRDRLVYTGVDSSSSLLSRARERSLPIARCEWIEEDLIETLLKSQLEGNVHNRLDPSVLDEGEPPYSLIGLFGVLHHVPSAALRSALLIRLGRRLAPGGVLALTCWQFAAFSRFREKIVGWDDYNRTASEPIDTTELEPGDHLLPWSHDAEVRRYCHFTDEREIQQLLEANFQIVDSYTSDGREGNLNRYFTCRYSSTQIAPKEGEGTD